MMLITIGALTYISFCLPNPNDKKSHERVIYLKDSLEMEYNKKQLESYKYDHSKIPTDDTIK